MATRPLVGSWRYDRIWPVVSQLKAWLQYFPHADMRG